MGGLKQQTKCNTNTAVILRQICHCLTSILNQKYYKWEQEVLVFIWVLTSTVSHPLNVCVMFVHGLIRMTEMTLICKTAFPMQELIVVDLRMW